MRMGVVSHKDICPLLAMTLDAGEREIVCTSALCRAFITYRFKADAWYQTSAKPFQ